MSTRPDLRDALLAAWRLFEGAGLARPWVGEEEARNALATWAAVLGGESPERITALAVAWLRRPQSWGRWPTPGELLAALGDADATDDADEAWARCLTLVGLRSVDGCPADVAAVLDLRVRCEGQYRDARAALARDPGDTRAAYRLRRAEAVGQALPARGREAAVMAGVGACGGWRSIGLADEDRLVTHRAAFRGAYRGHRARAALDGQQAQVAGLLSGWGGPSGRDPGPTPGLDDRLRRQLTDERAREVARG